MRFGEHLRQEREKKSVTLDGISATTRISVRYLEALESDQFKDLPGGIFNRGIVRAYARCCGMDEDETVDRFMAACREAGVEESTETADLTAFADRVRRSRPQVHSESNLRWLGVAAMVLTVLALAFVTAIVLHRRGLLALPHRQRSTNDGVTAGIRESRAQARYEGAPTPPSIHR